MITCDKCRYWDGYYCKNPSDYVNDKGEPVCGMRDDAIPVPNDKLGISPERLEELLQAEQEGRLIVLPCKVGDTVYAPFCGKVYRKTIDKIIINRFTTPQIWIETKLPFATSRLERWDMAIGKTVFLTREEAEAALSKAGDSE
jgi:hypothetical protein